MVSTVGWTFTPGLIYSLSFFYSFSHLEAQVLSLRKYSAAPTAHKVTALERSLLQVLFFFYQIDLCFGQGSATFAIGLDRRSSPSATSSRPLDIFQWQSLVITND